MAEPHETPGTTAVMERLSWQRTQPDDARVALSRALLAHIGVLTDCTHDKTPVVARLKLRRMTWAWFTPRTRLALCLDPIISGAGV